MKNANVERDSLISKLHAEGLSHAEIARQTHISRERVRQILIGIYGDATPVKLRSSFKRAQAVSVYLRSESGESFEEIAEDMMLSPSRLDKLLSEGIGLKRHVIRFRQWMSEQIGKTFANWLILSIEPVSSASTSKARCRVRARCLKCNTVHTVIFSNISSGCSTMCSDCGRKSLHQRCQPVQDQMTGNVYSSIKEASEVLGLTYNQARYRARAPKKLPSLYPL
jgi:transcriptional regulator with XRE-family HTH domain